MTVPSPILGRCCAAEQFRVLVVMLLLEKLKLNCQGAADAAESAMDTVSVELLVETGCKQC